MSAADLSAVVARLEAVASRLEATASGGGAGGAAASADDGDVPRSVEEFDMLVEEHVAPFKAAADEIGGAVAEQAALFVQAVNAQRAFLTVVAKSKKPSDAVFGSLLGPTAEPLGACIAACDAVGRSDPAFNALKAVAEGAPGLGWVQTTKPAPHCKSMGEAAEFYLNRVLKDNKEAHYKAFVRTFKAFWPALAAYCKQYHTTGPAWNPNGGDAPSEAPAAAAPAAAAASSSSAPDSAPPPTSQSVAARQGAAQAGLFAELNQGGAVTGGLRKVTRDMTNKDKKVASKVPAVAKPAPKKKAASKKGPAVFALQGNKWVVENMDDRNDLVISEAGRNQTVYMYKLDNCVVQIQSKVNSICMDACSKVGLVFTDAVSVVEVINCKSVQVQVTGRVPSINVDKTSGCQIFVSREAMDVEIVSSKTDEMNVVIPPADDDGDITECPVPEQFKTVINPETRTIEVSVVQHHG